MADDGVAPGQGLVVSAGEIDTLMSMMEEVMEQLDASRHGVTTSSGETRAMWQGDSAVQFGENAAQADEVFNRLINSLVNLHGLVKMSKDGFTAQEDEEASQLRTVTAAYQELNTGITG
ncbi:hypothetical protein [Streptomyces sp. RFCAC02]|uniref:WXG100 family type VII secretion target n=1 Tax=Streptomyces sp. RFCAC02 TaxID=2499143 RepID=UPI001021E021|nr:hypothetical protein [Streptomyces sp. RFCAC02]